MTNDTPTPESEKRSMWLSIGFLVLLFGGLIAFSAISNRPAAQEALRLQESARAKEEAYEERNRAMRELLEPKNSSTETQKIEVPVKAPPAPKKETFKLNIPEVDIKAHCMEMWPDNNAVVVMCIDTNREAKQDLLDLEVLSKNELQAFEQCLNMWEKDYTVMLMCIEEERKAIDKLKNY